MALGQLKSAEQTFLKVIKLAPEYQDCYLELGDVRKIKDDLPGAESAYSMGILQDPSWAPGYLWRGRLRYQRSDIFGAESDFRSAIQLAPNVAAPQYSLAHLLVEENGDLDMALKWAKSAVFLESAPEHQALLAFVYFRRDQVQLARAKIDRVYQQAPDNPDVLMWRKRIYQQ
jgi:tetratricopeptide (TPR) repeat protein